MARKLGGKIYWERIQKKQDGDHRMLSISLLKAIKLYVLLYFSTERFPVNTVYEEYILLFSLSIYLFHLFTNTFTTIYIRKLFANPGVDKRFASSRDERQPGLNIGENTFSMEQEVESFIPVPNGYFY